MYTKLTLFLICILSYTTNGSPYTRVLSEYIKNYEPLVYDALDLQTGDVRTRRSSDSSPDLRLRFKALGRDFHLQLRRDLSAFSDDLKVVNSLEEPHDVSMDHIYHGEIADEPHSKVFGSVTEGVFEGKIIANDGAYYVEHARRYFPPNGTRTKVHSVIYKESDVSDPYAHRRQGHASGCGVTDDVLHWMNSIQKSVVDEDSDTPISQAPTPHVHLGPSLPLKLNSLNDEPPRSSTVHNEKSPTVTGIHEQFRTKRSTGKKNRAKTAKTCSLYIHTDPTLWLHVRRGFPDHKDPSKKDEVDMKTKMEIVHIIAYHVTAANYIYRYTRFDGRVEHRNINFQVQKIKIDDEWTCNSRTAATNPFCATNINVQDFLTIQSQENHEDFCLAYTFTYRNFMDGILGLGWMASATGAAGGICEKQKTYMGTDENQYRNMRMSLNTGIITLVNYNATVPPRVSHLTFAHEIGHNFGSPHDYPIECRPGGQTGNFIMFANATSGNRPNNSRFSLCSLMNISAVLDAIHDGRKRNCLTTNNGHFCGNKIVEEGEECDCGYDENECTDRCCYPRQISPYEKEKNNTAKGCARRANTQCSASQGPCCNGDTCQFISTQNFTCRAATECSQAAFCSTTSADCPPLQPVSDFTTCHNGTQVCLNGECSDSICLAWDMKECFLSSAVVNRNALCQVACQSMHDPNTCRSTADFAETVGLPTGGISRQPGEPCDNFEGYCDMNQNCRPVGARP